MRLHKLHVEGFRRLQNATVHFGDATFCIGPNNAGKSSLLCAIEKLLSGDKRIPECEFYSEIDAETGETKTVVDVVVLEAEFRGLPADADTWRGFKGRVFDYTEPDGTTGKCIHYRKTYGLGKDVVIEIKSKTRALKAEYKECKTGQELIEAGASPELVNEHVTDLTKNLSPKEKAVVLLDDAFIDLQDEEEWFENPGGIPGNVLSRLPRFLRIPADASGHELDDPKKGVLGKTLNELFEDVRSESENFKDAQKSLDALAKELDPEDAASEFGKMMTELNEVLGGVFPDSQVHASADLSDPSKVLTPEFKIEMTSNVRTAVAHQGTGMVRAAVFGMLRFRQSWLAKREQGPEQSLIIGFEEPEIYLHPSAANQMRDTIYELSTGASQIVATTHSPYMIDLSRKPRQVLNRFRCDDHCAEVLAFSVTDEYLKLENTDKDYVKMVLKIDDYVARAFFTKTVIVVEGDSEDITLREALALLPVETRLRIRADFEIIKARGKASIIGLAKYLNALGISFRVLHDRDGGTAGAEVFNQPIQDAVGDPARVVVLQECLEDALGYPAPGSDKPLQAFKEAEGWSTWTDVPLAFREAMAGLFVGYVTAEL